MLLRSIFILIVTGCLHVNAQEFALPKHGIGFHLGANSQLPGTVISSDGSDKYVQISDFMLGWRGALLYYRSIGKRFRMGGGVQLTSLSYSFIWGGDTAAIPSFAFDNDHPVGLPVETWKLVGPAIEIQALLLQDRRLCLLGSLGANVGFGAASTVFSLYQDQSDGSQVQTIRIDTYFNKGRVPITAIRAFVMAEYQTKNYNRFMIGLGFSYVLNNNLITGTYSAYAPSMGNVQGTFRSAAHTIDLEAGYVLRWGHPKVPKRFQ